MLQKVIGEPEFRVRCLGVLNLIETRSGTDMTPARRKARALLAYLCIEKEPVGRERIAALLWGDRGDEQARASLRQTLYELRSPLGGERLLRTEGDSIVIGDYVSTDFEAIATAAESGDLELLRRGLSEWRGELLADLSSIDATYDAWLEAVRLRVSQTLIEAAAQAVKAGIEKGEIEQSRAIVNLLQERDGINEMVLRLGLKLDHLAGDSAALHRRYERFKKRLRSELDAAPSTETQRLFQELDTRTSASVPANESRSYDGAADNEARRAPKINEGAESNLAPLGSTPSAVDNILRISRPPARRRSAIAGVGALVTATLAALVWMLWPAPQKNVQARPEPLLAVLPFQNLGTDSSSRYFSDGITTEIVDALLRITQIRVASPASSFRLRGADAPAAAKALAATHLLGGSIRRDGSRIRVIAQLTDTRNNQVVWSGAYDRAMSEMPALQHDIAIQIANALEMRLSPTALNEARTINPEAYDHYLKGRDLLFQRNDEAAVAELNASIRLAPNFSRAWSSLAATRLVFASESVFSENFDNSMVVATRAAAQRALALDAGNGEALAVLATVTPSNRLLEIDRFYQRALQSEPNNAELLNLYGGFLIFVGRRREAANVLAHAYDLDRVIASVASNFVVALLDIGAYDKASEIIALSRDNKLQSEFVLLHSDYFLYQQDWPGLARYLMTPPPFISPRKAAFLRLWRETALALAAHDTNRFAPLRTRWRDASPLDPDESALFLSAIGYPDDALEVIQRAVKDERNDYLLTDPEWDALFVPGLAPLRRDPRVPALLAQWGLFDYWRATNRWPDFCDEPTLPFNCKAEALKYMHRTGAQRVTKRS